MHNEKHTIFHVDVNSAFLSWSALKRLKEDPDSVDLRTIPSAVGGDVKTRHGIITAKSIPAKKYGIKTAEPVVKALQKCPDLVLVPSDFETYRAYSKALMDLLGTFTPVLQQISIDEAWLDVTDLIRDNDRKEAVCLADRIRSTVYDQLGFTVNVGVSENKLLSKVASDFSKPDKTHTLYPDEIREKMWPLPVGELYGCGHATAEKLQAIGVHTIGDAAAMSLPLLQSILGEKAGEYIHNSANGISLSFVKPEREKAKSISNEVTLSEDITRDNYREKGIPVINKLSEKVAGRLKKTAMYGQTVTFQVKTSDFRRYSRQLALPNATDDEHQICEAALTLAEHLLTASDGLFASGAAIRLIGVGVTKLTEGENLQMDLFSWQEEKAEMEKSSRERQKRAEKQAQLDEMIKKIDQRYGNGVVRKGAP